MLVFAFQNSLIIPIDLAFEPAWTKNIGLKIFDNMVDILFIIDMCIMFFSSFLDKMGEEI